MRPLASSISLATQGELTFAHAPRASAAQMTNSPTAASQPLQFVVMLASL